MAVPAISIRAMRVCACVRLINSSAFSRASSKRVTPFPVLADILAEVLNAKGKDGKVNAEVLMKSLVYHAIKKGNPGLFKEILDRIDGKVIERLNIEGMDDITVRFKREDEECGEG